MKARHLVFLVEEPSMEAFLRSLLPRLLPPGVTFEVHPFQGKTDLLARLRARLRGYAAWLPEDWRIVVLVDRDDDDCKALKQVLEDAAADSGLRSRSRAGPSRWQVVNRVVVEELEAWYFGDWEAVREAHPRVGASLPRKPRFRDPDAIPGGTWEAFERVLQRRGYYRNGLPKVEVARTLGSRISPARCRSKSFQTLRDALLEAVR